LALVQAVVVETRTVRSGNKIPPKDKVRLFVKTAGAEETAALESQAAFVRTLAGLESLELVAALPAGEGLLKGVAGPFEIGLVPPQPADAGQERDRLERDLAKAAAEIEKIERKLGNADFVAKAPAAVVEENRARLAELLDRRDKLGRNLAKLAA
jgi:valyl-tRNA synthetase